MNRYMYATCIGTRLNINIKFVCISSMESLSFVDEVNGTRRISSIALSAVCENLKRKVPIGTNVASCVVSI